MSTQQNIVITFIIIVFLTPVTEAAIVVQHVMTKDPKEGSACETPLSNYSFTFSDEFYSWALVEQGHSSDMVGFVWYDAQGGSHCHWYTGFDYEGKGCTWESFCSIDPSTFQDIQGVWHVDFFYNGVKLSTVNFLLTLAGTPCPAEVLYGEHSAETELLRNFRDRVLFETPEGRELINLYYQWSDLLTTMMTEDEQIKEEVRLLVNGVLELLQ